MDKQRKKLDSRSSLHSHRLGKQQQKANLALKIKEMLSEKHRIRRIKGRGWGIKENFYHHSRPYTRDTLKLNIITRSCFAEEKIENKIYIEQFVFSTH